MRDAAEPPAIPTHLCPHCGSVTAHPNDVARGYCGRCDHRCADVPEPAQPPVVDAGWCVAGARVVVDNIRSSFHGEHGRVIRPVSPDHPIRLVLVGLGDSLPVGEVEFGLGELKPEAPP